MNTDIMGNKVAVIGTGSIGSTVANRLVTQGHHIEVYDVANDPLTDLGDTNPLMDICIPESNHAFIIKKIPELPEIWFDPKKPVFNRHKHNLTCTKNRKKRKKNRHR